MNTHWRYLMTNHCRCRSGRARLWCWLDWATQCRIPAVCNRHDKAMIR